MSSVSKKPRGAGKRAAGVGASILAFLAVSVAAGVLVSAIVAPGAVAVGSAASTGVSTFNALPDYLKIGPTDQQTTFYGMHNGQPTPIATFYAQNRIDVPLSQMSKYVQNAAIATEDPRFYSEGGIDPIGTIRAFLSNSSGNSVQGGSSITQQYVKNVLEMQCVLDYPISTSAPAATQAKQQAAYDSCYDKVTAVKLDRKVQEIRYAMGLSKTYSKNTILQSYLNIIPFGGQVYGVQAAARYYFNTDALHLTLNQAATLIAIENNPNQYRLDMSAAQLPGNNGGNGFKATLNRRNYVLNRMLIEKDITQAEYDATVKEPIKPTITPTPSGCMSDLTQSYNAGFFCNYVQNVMLSNSVFGKTQAERDSFFTQGGLQVYTTLNVDLNNQAQLVLNTDLQPQAGVDLGAANVALQQNTGNIVEMVENATYDDSASAQPGSTSVNYNTPFDMGGSTGFQTGSSFKPFVLAAWLEAGNGIYNTVNGYSSPHNFSYSSYTGYQPPGSPCLSETYPGSGTFPIFNDEGDEGGTMPVLSATTNSVNTAYMQMTTKLNMCNIANIAHTMGVNSADPDYAPWQVVPTQTLGVNAVSPLQMATAYAGFANQGEVCDARAIDHITTTAGKNVDVPPISCNRAIPADIANGVEYALQRVMSGGTAARVGSFGGTVMGKTGTTDHQVQNWLVTATTQVAQATWVGNVQGSVNLANKRFHAPTTGNPYTLWAGNDIKFPIVKAIQTNLNAAYPPGPLPTASNAVLYGTGYNRYSASSPTTTAAPTPTVTPTTAPANPATVPDTNNKPAQSPATTPKR